MDMWDFIKNTIKKDTIKKMKFLATDQDKIADKGFESRIYKELVQLSNKKHQFSFLNRQKIWTGMSQKQIYEGQKAHEKMLNLVIKEMQFRTTMKYPLG